jgi:DNA-binding MarR family transcriptional regulator
MVDSVFSVERAEDCAGFVLWQTTITWQRLTKKALEPYNISHTQFALLAILLWFEKIHQEATQIVLANWSKLDKMTVSKSLKILARQGYIERAEHEIDTRAKKVALTPGGRMLASKLVPIVEGIDEQFFGVMGQDDRKVLLRLLNQMILRKLHD